MLTRKLTKRMVWYLPLVAAGMIVLGDVYRSVRQEFLSGEDMIPAWETNPRFERDAFTFVRIQYNTDRDTSTRGRGRRGGRGGGGGYGGGFGGGGGRLGGDGDNYGAWMMDAPGSDLNFSYRLQQMTSMKVNPNGRILDLTDAALRDYPFIYLVEPGSGGLSFSAEEVKVLRKYLLNGGFLMVDDFWGVSEYEVFYEQIKRVFPDREPQELPLEHPIFHGIFDLKEKPQIPSVRMGMQSEFTGVTWERSDARVPEYKAIFDDKGRIMVMICHNTDLGDGWEREGNNLYYFKEFSEKKAYPLGINIVFYAMTH